MDRIDIFPTKILLATDGSEDAALATRAAADLSIRTGSDCTSSMPGGSWPPILPIPAGY